MKTYLKDLTLEEIIKRLKNGEVVKINNSKNYYKMIDGFLCYIGEFGSIINDSIIINEGYEYFETEEPLIFEQGKFYKTREGKKAYISKITATYIYGIVTEKTSSETWKLDGTHWNKENPHKNDLISKWED